MATVWPIVRTNVPLLQMVLMSTAEAAPTLTAMESTTIPISARLYPPVPPPTPTNRVVRSAQHRHRKRISRRTMDQLRNLLTRYPIISPQVSATELSIIISQLSRAISRHSAGAIVEFGCYIGTTSLFIRRVMDELGATGEFHVYDSFVGLPDKTKFDRSPVGEQFRSGELAASSRDFTIQFRKAGLQLPIIHRSWFADLTPADVPTGIAFAFFDGDYYESIRDSFRLVTPKLLPGAVVIVDDYTNDALPGAARAVDEWLRVHPAKLQVNASLAIIKL